MSCAYSRGVVLCQTDPIGAAAVLTTIVLLVVLAYYIGRTGRLRDRVSKARVAETSDTDPRDD